MTKPIETEQDLTPMQRTIIQLVEDGYTLRFRDTWSLTYGKGDQRVTVHHDGTTTAFTVAAQ